MTPEELFELCHQQAHDAEHNPDDTLFLAVTRRDTWLIYLSLLLTREAWDCLEKEAQDLIERLTEIVEVQKDGWRK